MGHGNPDNNLESPCILKKSQNRNIFQNCMSGEFTYVILGWLSLHEAQNTRDLMSCGGIFLNRSRRDFEGGWNLLI
jgi:hypothetical protein